MRAAARLDRADAVGLQRLVPGQEFAVLPREDIVRDHRDITPAAQLQAKLEHQRRLSTADRPAHANRERPPLEIPIQWEVALVEVAGVIEVIVSMTIAAGPVKMKEEVHRHSTLKQPRV
jgi:hypothetical protein